MLVAQPRDSSSTHDGLGVPGTKKKITGSPEQGQNGPRPDAVMGLGPAQLPPVSAAASSSARCSDATPGEVVQLGAAREAVGQYHGAPAPAARTAGSRSCSATATDTS